VGVCEGVWVCLCVCGVWGCGWVWVCMGVCVFVRVCVFVFVRV